MDQKPCVLLPWKTFWFLQLIFSVGVIPISLVVMYFFYRGRNPFDYKMATLVVFLEAICAIVINLLARRVLGSEGNPLFGFLLVNTALPQLRGQLMSMEWRSVFWIMLCECLFLTIFSYLLMLPLLWWLRRRARKTVVSADPLLDDNF